MPITFKAQITPFSARQLEAISRGVGDTENGLTGSNVLTMICFGHRELDKPYRCRP